MMGDMGIEDIVLGDVNEGDEEDAADNPGGTKKAKKTTEGESSLYLVLIVPMPIPKQSSSQECSPNSSSSQPLTQH